MTLKILAIDDSPSMRRRIRAVLERDGHVVVEAGDGLEALTMLETMNAEPPDLIVTDLYMPGLDGLSLVRLVRKFAEYRVTPILVVTAECSDVMKRRGRAAGATGWLLKPFYDAALARAVTRALGAATARRRRIPRPPGAPDDGGTDSATSAGSRSRTPSSS